MSRCFSSKNTTENRYWVSCTSYTTSRSSSLNSYNLIINLKIIANIKIIVTRIVYFNLINNCISNNRRQRSCNTSILSYHSSTQILILFSDITRVRCITYWINTHIGDYRSRCLRTNTNIKFKGS